ncbi:hypothetical protein [Flavobacterium sp.]|uniref:hypothetical protein n=1 Tax=Flavobacterium sp. TaxID=239 RepID=UPI0037509BBF
MKNSDIKIAGNLTINDWGDLEKGLKNMAVENWGLAFYFFEERIRTRYLNPINTILDMDLKTGEGFAVVNLQCSLIETIESFINGWVYNAVKDKSKQIIANRWYNKKIEVNNLVQIDKLDDDKSLKNVDIFISFFNKREPFKDLLIKGDDFFWNIRCALLHETQTKNGWKIKANGVDKSIKDKIIYRDLFQKDIETVIENYKKSIIVNDNITTIGLRENFIAKFNHICKESQ